MIKFNGKYNKIKIDEIMIFIYFFIIVYTPPLLSLFGINANKYVVVVPLTLVVFVYYLFFRINRLNKILFDKNNLLFIVGIVISSIYIVIIALFNGYETRGVQNVFLIYQFINVMIVIDLLRRKGYQHEDLIKFIFNVVLVQSIICILMLIIPSFREIALELYFNNGPRNTWIERSRIYGISSDYTYSTPIFHGIIAAVMMIYGIEYNWKYILYIPFVLCAIMLNGRTGIIIFLVGVIIISCIYILRSRKLKKMMGFILATIVIGIIGISVIKYFAYDTYMWILKGVDEILKFLIEGEKIGTVAALENVLYFPKGIYMLFGEGHRVYGQVGYIHSDIGFVNDIFLGGITYVAILYITIFKYCCNRIKWVNNNKLYYVNKTVSFILIPILLIANYKGECMREGIILTGIFFVKGVLLTENNSKQLNK